MLSVQARDQSSNDADEVFEARIRLLKAVAITALGLFIGGVLGGVLGLFAYANARNPAPHDVMYAILQSAGIIVGLLMGYLAARNSRVHEEMLEASLRAGGSLLRRYRPKPGTGGVSNIGHRTIGSDAAEGFLNTLIAKKP
jgi:multidrug transporter EmrE-like cation transporter